MVDLHVCVCVMPKRVTFKIQPEYVYRLWLLCSYEWHLVYE